jgi:alpha-tubulin suppressor-like RCC1 family protein
MENKIGKRMKSPYLKFITIIFVGSSLGPACSNLRHAPENAPSVYRIEAGGPQTCIYSRTELECWGWNYYSVLGKSPEGRHLTPLKMDLGLQPIDSVSLGTNHICLLSAGAVHCWGWNKYRQAGQIESDSLALPAKVNLPEEATAVSARGSHSCARLKSGQVYCWGKNYYGQVSAEKNLKMPPTAVAALENEGVTRLESSYHHSCALAKSGLWCWGWNEMFQLGDRSGSPNPRRVNLTAGRIDDFALGAFHTCALQEGKLYCWGRNDLGQLGLKSPKLVESPTKIDLPIRPERVFAGYKHTCVYGEGKLLCTGWNAAGQLGYTTQREFSDRFLETAFKVENPESLSAGYIHSCFERQGAFYCWGGNRMGQLGDGGIRSSSSPVMVRWSRPSK